MVGRKKSRPEFKDNVVYLYQAPRHDTIPSISPFVFAVETYLRCNSINYEVIPEVGVTIEPDVAQVKLNKKELASSYSLFDELAKSFEKETDYATPLDQATAYAFETMIEERLFWVFFYLLANENSQMYVDTFQARLPQLMRPFAGRLRASKMKSKAVQQGIGRRSLNEVIEMGEECLRSLSVYLGGKKFMGGDNPNKLDALAFGHLAQFWYAGVNEKLKKFMNNDCSNLVDYLERMKTVYYSDWEQLCVPKTKPAPTKTETETNGNGEANTAAPVANGTPEKTAETTPTNQMETTAQVEKKPETAEQPTPTEKTTPTANGQTETPATNGTAAVVEEKTAE